jgi:TolB protein
VGFWWSPDGRTIAALRVQPIVGPRATLVPRPSSSPTPATEVRLVFLDVASGTVRSDPVVQPAPRFVNQVLAYFDQYALSHRVWAPDSSSILLPEVQPDGSTALTVRFPDGGASIPLGGEIGFWSP